MCYLRAVEYSVVRRLALLLSVAALVLATALAGTASAMAMSPQTPCRHCSDKAPAKGDLGKMACGALVCAGVAIALPARQAPFYRVAATLAYARGIATDIVGASPVPDPEPPRPIVLS